MKNKGEHTCRSCNCIANVVISRVAYALASLVCIIALLLVVLYSIGGDHSSVLGIISVLIPFLIFYILIPFFVRLVPCRDKSAVQKLMDKASALKPAVNVPAPAPVSMPDYPISQAKPVELDVEEDFAAKFMKAKNNVQHKTMQESAEQEGAVPHMEENINNTRIAFEIGTKDNTSPPEQ